MGIRSSGSSRRASKRPEGPGRKSDSILRGILQLNIRDEFGTLSDDMPFGRPVSTVVPGRAVKNIKLTEGRVCESYPHSYSPLGYLLACAPRSRTISRGA